MRADVVVVGGGVVGLAHALACARRGDSVIVIERHREPVGASIQNFGLVLQVGQRGGAMRERAERSAALWRELAEAAKFSLDPCGLMILARSYEEWAVLEEFMDRASESGHRAELLGKGATLSRLPAAREPGLLGALSSPCELTVDPREALPAIASWLEAQCGVRFLTGTTVLGIDAPRVETEAGTVLADRIFVCASDDFRTLYPREFRERGFGRCKLQMMRTLPQPDGFRLGPVVMGGLSLVRYPAFVALDGLQSLRARLEAESPEQLRHGVHVIAVQGATGAITLGDSHDMDAPDAPFRSEAIDRLLLESAAELVHIPSMEIAERWIGRYPVAQGPELCVFAPAPAVRVVSFTAGVGMSLAFAVAEEVVRGSMATAQESLAPAELESP